jgi:ABC-type cobalamin/Fe3+-siderophores transport system ATPase subunit
MALKKGRLAAFGPMAEILTADLLREVFEVEVKIVGAGERAYVDYAGAAER